MTSRSQRISVLINEYFKPAFLKVEDESYQHHVSENAQTHFKLILVSELFIDKTRIARHRMVNEQLKAEFDTGLHALSLHLFTPKEWEEQEGETALSPKCRGGLHHER